MDEGPMTSGWLYVKRGMPAESQVGPLTWEELWQAAQSGALEAHDLVWHASLPEWLPATRVAGLFADAGAKGKMSETRNAAVAGPGARRTRPAWLVPLVIFGLIAVVALAVGLGAGLRGSGGNDRSLVSGNGSGEPGTWTVLIYADADNEVLEEDMCFDLNEAEVVGSTDQVKVVAQIDRYDGGYAGDGDVTTARRYLLAKDSDLYALGSPVLEDLGEVDMGDPKTLQDFATWAIKTYSADHYVLIMSNHGAGWAGGWTDDAPNDGSGLGMQQIDNALATIVAETGIGEFELVGFDACLMAQTEVMSALAPHAHYAVASEETEPALGWSYAGFLTALTEDTSMTGAELGRAIVDSYLDQDLRVTDEEARRQLTGGDFTAQNVVDELGRTSTMATIDLSKVRGLVAAVNDLVLALTAVDQSLVAEARAYAQSYASLFSSGDPNQDMPPSFIDLGNFVDLVLTVIDDADVSTAGQAVKEALGEAVVTERHGAERPGSSGLVIYFPASIEYGATFAGDVIDYPSSIGRFATASLWDNYLTFHYTGEPVDAGSADLSAVTPALAAVSDFSKAAEQSAPAAGAQVVGPGSGGVTIAPLTLSTDTLTASETVTLSTQIGGANIAYVYYYIAYYWEADGSFLSADAGYVEPGDVKQIGGVYYPDWGDGSPVDVEQQWNPTLYYMSDGNEAHDQFAFFEPTAYGADVAADIYTVRGTYAFIDTGTKIDAEIDFNGNGDMVSVWGYSADDNSGVGSWHELTPRAGDSFTITDEYLEFANNPDGEFVDYDGGTMTFGDTLFTIAKYSAQAGDYVIGIGVEDLDGNVTWEYADVTVSQ
jgi:hypothetical protein